MQFLLNNFSLFLIHPCFNLYILSFIVPKKIILILIMVSRCWRRVMSCSKMVNILLLMCLPSTHFSLSLLTSLGLHKLSQTLLLILTIAQILVYLPMEDITIFHWRINLFLFVSRTIDRTMWTCIEDRHSWHNLISLFHLLLRDKRFMIFYLLSLSNIIKTTPIISISKNKIFLFLLTSYY